MSHIAHEMLKSIDECMTQTGRKLNYAQNIVRKKKLPNFHPEAFICVLLILVFRIMPSYCLDSK